MVVRNQILVVSTIFVVSTKHADDCKGLLIKQIILVISNIKTIYGRNPAKRGGGFVEKKP